MKSEKFILAVDQGTTSSRAIVFDKEGQIVASAQQEFTQHFPKPGWVEHNALEILESQLAVAKEVIAKVGVNNIAAIGITNQRETTIIWDRKTGQPIHNAIVWQDRRTSDYCNQLKAAGHNAIIQSKTGLLIDPYFSGTKIKWLLDNVPGARQRANNGELVFGTVDSWLIWHLTNGAVHATDVTNASRTMLYNIHDLCWDVELLQLLDIPKNLLPEVKDCVADFGKATALYNLPITGVAGDQQAALFGQQCTTPGDVKNTYGTGCFTMMNTGNKVVKSKHKLLSTIGWKIGGDTVYAIEGSVFVAGAVVQWLRDGLGIIKDSNEVEALATSVEDNGGVYFVSSFTGLGAPHWNSEARGQITGLTRGSTKAHIARAALESIAYQCYDVIKAMEEDAGITISSLKVDGGATNNNFLMQFQADVLHATIEKPSNLESTALGAAMMAGLGCGFWANSELGKLNVVKEQILSGSNSGIEQYLEDWKKAVSSL